jgi:hypothetical protein
MSSWIHQKGGSTDTAAVVADRDSTGTAATAVDMNHSGKMDHVVHTLETKTTASVCLRVDRRAMMIWA